MNEPRRADAKARRRLEVILLVLGGQITATEGATRLGVSRKTYYEWQAKGLAALTEALADQPAGRPPNLSDPEKDRLQRENASLRTELNLTRQASWPPSNGPRTK